MKHLATPLFLSLVLAAGWAEAQTSTKDDIRQSTDPARAAEVEQKARELGDTGHAAGQSAGRSDNTSEGGGAQGPTGTEGLSGPSAGGHSSESTGTSTGERGMTGQGAGTQSGGKSTGERSGYSQDAPAGTTELPSRGNQSGTSGGSQSGAEGAAGTSGTSEGGNMNQQPGGATSEGGMMNPGMAPGTSGESGANSGTSGNAEPSSGMSERPGSDTPKAGPSAGEMEGTQQLHRPKGLRFTEPTQPAQPAR